MFRAIMAVRIASLKNWLLSDARTKKGSSKGKALLFGLLILYAFCAIGFMIYSLFSQLSEPYYTAGFGWLYFALYALMNFALVFIGSIFASKSQLYEAKDNDLLLSMPIPPRLILTGRMLTLLIINYIISLVTTVPAALAWYLRCPITPAGAVAFVLIALLLPLLALAVSALAGWLLSLLTRRIRRKSLLTTILSLAFLAIYFIGMGKVNSAVQKLIVSGGEIAEGLRAALPLWWIGNAIAEGKILYLLNAAAFCVIPFALAYVLLSSTFINTVTSQRGFTKVTYVERELKTANAFSALYRREMARFLSSSIYVMNAGLGAAFLVVAGVLLVIKQDTVRSTVQLMEGAGAYLSAVLILGLCLVSGMAMISAPSVSMEGKSLWIVRSLPVLTQNILRAKLLVHLSIAGPASLVGGIGAAIAARTSLFETIMCLLIPLVFTALVALIGLVSNLNHTNLDWMNETQAVKNSVAVLISMAAATLAVAASAAALYGLMRLGLPMWLNLAILLAALIVACNRLYGWVLHRGADRFEAL